MVGFHIHLFSSTLLVLLADSVLFWPIIWCTQLTPPFVYILALPLPHLSWLPVSKCKHVAPTFKQVCSSIPQCWRAHLSILRNICVMWQPIMSGCKHESNPDCLNASHFPAAKSPPQRALPPHTWRQLSPGEQPLPLNLHDKPFPHADQSST